MTARDAEIVQATSNLHHQIRKALFGQPQDIFDNPAPFDPSDHVFDYYPCTGEDGVEQLLADA